MKRVGYLIEQIADMDNLRLAFFKAQCHGKATKPDVMLYRRHLQDNLLQLRTDILCGTVKLCAYHLFQIHDPKERTVCAAQFPDRVLHHALMNVCLPFFERNLVSTTCANRVGKGVYYALEIGRKAVNRYSYVAKLDVRKYFDSIDHATLKRQLSRLFKDSRLLALFWQIIDSYSVAYGCGLPIGNLTSQYMANLYLSGLDHYTKEVLKVPVYVRYMDDILLFGNDKNVLAGNVKAVEHYAAEVLKLCIKPPVIQTCMSGIPFLGYRLRRHIVGLAVRSKRRFVSKYTLLERQFAYGTISEYEAQQNAMPLFAFVKHAYSKHYRHHVIQRHQVVGV